METHEESNIYQRDESRTHTILIARRCCRCTLRLLGEVLGNCGYKMEVLDNFGPVEPISFRRA